MELDGATGRANRQASQVSISVEVSPYSFEIRPRLVSVGGRFFLGASSRWTGTSKFRFVHLRTNAGVSSGGDRGTPEW